MMVVIAEHESRVDDEAGIVKTRLANSITWMPEGNRRVIIAVGSPSQWHSSLPLPPEAVSVDLLEALNDSKVAAEFWAPFLAYLVKTAGPNWWREFFMLKVPVRVELDERAQQAVARAVKSSPFG
jgi:hypothetical protein